MQTPLSSRAMNPLDPRAAGWQITAEPGPDTSALADAMQCDVAIVGAGFTGLRAALALAETGSKVAVFDAGKIAHGASGRNGGQVNPMLPCAYPEDLRRAVGNVFFERMARVSLGSADELFDLVRKYDIDCDARQHGWMRVDHCSKARDTARAAPRQWNRFDAGFQFLDGEDTKALSGSPAYESATVNPSGGAVQPLKLARGLARAALEAGVSIYSESPVKELVRIDQRWTLQANGHPVRADRVILATNGYSDNLFPGLRRSVLPITPTQIATDPLPEEEIGNILPKGHTISDTRRLIMYARREPDNRMFFGGTGYRTPFGSLGGFKWTLRDAQRIFPSIPAHRWKYRWGGRIALTPDRVPHFHEPAPGLVAGLGYNGRGVAISLVMGRVLAERILGADPSDLPFPDTPISPQAFRDTQVAGAGIAMTWMRMLDNRELRSGTS